MNNNIMVSINCVTYNHESYIADAIESFVMQKTNFPFEILIYDDASTDETPNIIRQYEAKYPNLIKPIYQTDNQYSKGVVVTHFNFRRAKGKYIANCEGDDFWTDPYKLQKQVDYMEKHPQCSLCVHASHKVTPDKKKLNKSIRNYTTNKIFTVEEIIKMGGGAFATNSMLYPTKYTMNRPEWCEKSLATDYPLQIYLALQGPIYYMDDFMSAYRIYANGSWSNTMKDNRDLRIKHIENRINMFHLLDKYTGYKYDEIIKKTIQYKKIMMLLEKGHYKEVRQGELKYAYHSLSNKRKLIIFIKQKFPHIAKILIAVKYRFFG